MSQEQVTRYREAVKLRDAALRDVQALAKIVGETAKGLDAPLDFRVSNSGVSFIPVGARHHVVNAHEWPTARQIAEAVATLQRHENTATNAWLLIPLEERRGLSGPDQIGHRSPWR